MVSGSLGLLASDGCVTSHCHTQQHTDLCVKRINEQPSDGREKSATIGDAHEWGSVWFSHYRHEDEGGEGSGDQGDKRTHLIKPLKGVGSEDHLSIPLVKGIEDRGISSRWVDNCISGSV